MSTDADTDYRFKFKIQDLSKALNALALLVASNIVTTGSLPENMLGQFRDSTGSICSDETKATWIGSQGKAAGSYKDEAGNTITTAAVGDPSYYYIAIRSPVTPDKIPFNPADYGLIQCSQEESALVLGTWAS